MTDLNPQYSRPTVTAVELAEIAGVEAKTVRKIAGELLEMLEKDLQRRELDGVVKAQ